MKKIILAIAIIASYTSCEKTVTVDVPMPPSKLVVNGIVQANNLFTVNVGKSETVLSTNTINSFKVNNAFVQLYENNILKDTLLYNSVNNNYVVKNATVATIGKNYKLVATLAGFATVDAETTTPSNIMIQNISRIVNARTDANGGTQDEIKIKFTDNASETNYYLFKIKKPVNYSGSQLEYRTIFCLKSSDVDIDKTRNTDPLDVNSCIDNGFLMADKNFNGNTKTISLFVNSYELTEFTYSVNQKKYKAIVEMNNISKNYYNYRRSIQTYKDNVDNPFSEAVLVYTNVNNGYGIFSSYTAAIDTIR
jgi:Domain of unknown function (DUF4249)